jgi:membrane-bound lytic murein transglycosylase A
LQSKRAAELYRAVTIPGVDQGRVVRSLRRFRELVEQSQDATELRRRVWEEFEVFESVGRDGMGRVRFTGYFAPVYRGSLQRDERFRYPLYGAPAEGGVKLLRRELEGLDGLTPNPAVKGRELVYLDNRFDAFLIHIQGSARILLADGNAVTVGYAAGSDFPFVSVAQELIRDKRLTLKDTSLSGLREFFRKNPALLDEYLPRNNRFIFFKNLHDSPPRGSLGVPVTPERSIATDKAFMPPGALALINTEIPVQTPGTGVNRTGLKHQWVSRYVLDQDAGSAIRTPGRVDLYMGMGDEAGERAGRINSTGRLYYLLLREG